MIKTNKRLNYNTKIETHKSKISIENLCWGLLFVQFIANNIARNSMIYDILAMLFIITTTVYLYHNKAIRINKYYILTLAFIVYNITLVSTGGAFDSIHSWKMIITVTLNLVLSVIIYSFFTYSKDEVKILNVFIYAVFISTLLILIIYRDTLLTGRLAFSWRDSSDITYTLLGMKLMTAGSNAIAYFMFIAFMLSIYMYMYVYKKKRYIIFSIIFIITALLTGSRKGILFFIMGAIFYILSTTKGIKKIISIMLSILLVLIVYYVMIKNETLYDVLGYRMEQLVNVVFGKSFDDGSISTRLLLIDKAKKYFIENPIFGYGLDSFRVMANGIVSDNNFYEIAVSSGIIGLIIYYLQIPMLFIDYVFTINKTKLHKVVFVIFVLTFINSLIGNVIYYSRDAAFVNTLLFYTIYMRRYNLKLSRG